jgi:ATP-dependent Clp protease protease subunit
MENNFLNFKKKSETETELYIYGNIEKKNWIDDWLGTGKEKTDAFTLKDALMQVDTPNLTVRINSYGGDVSEGLAIYSLLSEFKGHLKTIVDGFACSAASVIFMAGKERVVPENGLIMIHNAWTEARGDSNKMKKVAEDLEKITQPSLNIYVRKTNLSEKEIKEKMDREEWITSQEAYEWGFSTTQIRKNDAMQSLEADFVYNLVMKNKELQKSIAEYAERATEKKLKEDLEGSATGETHGSVGNLEQKKIKEDAWTSFFNKKIF